MCLVTQSCLTLCDPMDCSPPDSFVHGDSPGTNTGVGCHALHQGIFPTQGSNRGLLHCRWILYQLRYYFYFNNLEVNFGKKSNFPCIRNKLGALDCVLGRQLCSALVPVMFLVCVLKLLYCLSFVSVFLVVTVGFS